MWTSFNDSPQEMENIKCWIIKGAYNGEDKELLDKCHNCKYFLAMNGDTGIAEESAAGAVIISCEGTLNNDRTRALDKVWEKLKKAGTRDIILDLSQLNNVYSCGLGLLVKIHKEIVAGNGMFVICGARGYVEVIFSSTKLFRIIHNVPDRQAALALFDRERKKREQAEMEASAKAKPPAPKKRISCWEYWDERNPRNATGCRECFRMVSPSTEPCWIVEGMIEGVSFQYVNEGCERCEYLREYGSVGQSNPENDVNEPV